MDQFRLGWREVGGFRPACRGQQVTTPRQQEQPGLTVLLPRPCTTYFCFYGAPRTPNGQNIFVEYLAGAHLQHRSKKGLLCEGFARLL
ncbi:hypothetical protein NDU88_000079 [Pleurodeles waltl]|uniref:Uncharacterized protein n=1 Tax=Pleurodeles waltl TaxID=8319 RepID=A0AAV7VXB6_PLEWA|nr:hypothetical protein NDU88_000079 [Pleurodeles waltl]